MLGVTSIFQIQKKGKYIALTYIYPIGHNFISFFTILQIGSQNFSIN